MNRHWLIEFFRWDARTVLAAVLGLAVLIGFTWAATSNSLVVKFDFGGASSTDNETGAIPVKGGLSVYPKISGVFQYGWDSASISEFVDKNVTDKMQRDYNTGVNGSVFKISGLEPGAYSFKATVGAPSAPLSTKIQSGALATSVTTAPGNWGTASLNVMVDNSGTVELTFSSSNGIDSWGIDGLSIYTATGSTTPGFEITLDPTQKTMRAGDTAAFSVGVTPVNNYASRVSAAIAGLVTGMTAEFIPAQIASPPGTMELRVYTTTNVPPTVYDLVLTVKGDDPTAVQKTMHVKLTLTAAGVTTPLNNSISQTDNTLVGPNGESGDQALLDLPPRTAKEVKEDFAKVESFAAEQKAKAIQQKNFLEIKDIGDSLAAGAPVYTDLPKPTSVTESFLQKMVSAGIIGTISDAAPQVQTTPEPMGFWEKIFQGVFRPAS